MQGTHPGLGVDAGGRRAAPNYRTQEPSFLRGVKLSVQLSRFTARYFAQLEVEYESLCPDEYKNGIGEELEKLRHANEAGPSWALNHRLEYLTVAGLPESILK